MATETKQVNGSKASEKTKKELKALYFNEVIDPLFDQVLNTVNDRAVAAKTSFNDAQLLDEIKHLDVTEEVKLALSFRAGEWVTEESCPIHKLNRTVGVAIAIPRNGTGNPMGMGGHD